MPFPDTLRRIKNFNVNQRGYLLSANPRLFKKDKKDKKIKMEKKLERIVCLDSVCGI